MFEDFIDWITSIFSDDVDVPTEDVGVSEAGDVDAAVEGSAEDVEAQNVDVSTVDVGGGTVESGSVDDMITNGIKTDAVTNEELAEMQGKKDQISFTGACQCNVCGCDCFVPTKNDPSRCICGHTKFQHLWK